MIEIDESGAPIGDDQGTGWYPQYRRSQKWARAEYPDGYNVELPGFHAWSTLTEQERADAMGSLFSAYASVIHDEDNSRLMTKAADNGTSYLAEWDVSMLWDSALSKPDEYGEVTADRSALLNVLCELELLQYRLNREGQ